MKKIIVFLLIAGLLLIGTCAITADEEVNSNDIAFDEPIGEPPAPCGGGGGAGEGGAPG